MKALFDAAPEYLTGPYNQRLLKESVSSSFPGIELVDKNDNNWYLSNQYAINYPLPDGPAMISTLQTSSRRRKSEWDLRKLYDHL